MYHQLIHTTRTFTFYLYCTKRSPNPFLGTAL